MKRPFILFIFTTFFSFQFAFSQWIPDILGEGFESRNIQMANDYEGAVNCVLTRSLPAGFTKNAVLYVHGFNDYFFHTEQAENFNQCGYAFYAVDLRKYGRSYLEHQRRGNLRSMEEYYLDIDTCLKIIRERHSNIILMGHSTGGLAVAMYAHENCETLLADGLILNSPFIDMNFSKMKKNPLIYMCSGIGSIIPNAKIYLRKDNHYAETIHADYRGEWIYDLDWKRDKMIPIYFGWLRAVMKSQKKLQKDLDIRCPVLIMHSDKSVAGKKFEEDFFEGDAVLRVDKISKYALCLGDEITVEVIEDGVHDLFLSQGDVRESVYEKVFNWLELNGL